MTVLNFPSTNGQPTNGSFTHEQNGIIYSWDGDKWSASAESASNFYLSKVNDDTADGTITFKERQQLQGGFLSNSMCGIKVDNPTSALDVGGTVKATKFVGPLDGNASSADTATQSDGLKVSSTGFTGGNNRPIACFGSGINPSPDSYSDFKYAGNNPPTVNGSGELTANAGFKGDLTGNVTGDVTGNLTGIASRVAVNTTGNARPILLGNGNNNTDTDKNVQIPSSPNYPRVNGSTGQLQAPGGVSGDVIGNVTGDVTGNVSGNATSANSVTQNSAGNNQERNLLLKNTEGTVNEQSAVRFCALGPTVQTNTGRLSAPAILTDVFTCEGDITCRGDYHQANDTVIDFGADGTAMGQIRDTAPFTMDKGGHRIWEATSSGEFASQAIKNHPSSSSANIRINTSNGVISTISSTRATKTNIQEITEAEAYNVLNNIQPVSYKPLVNIDEGVNAYALPHDEYYGFIAEDVFEVDSRLADLDADGNPISVNYDRMAAPLLTVCKKQQQLIEELTARVEALEADHTTLMNNDGGSY